MLSKDCSVIIRPHLIYISHMTVFVQGVFLRSFYGEREEYRKAVRPEVSEEETPRS